MSCAIPKWLFIGIMFLAPSFRSVEASAAGELEAAIAKRLGPETQQVVVVTPKSGFSAELEFFDKTSGVWRKKVNFPAVIGKKGFASAGEKREGDGKTPTGIYDFSTAFGYGSVAPTRMPYRETTNDDKFIDDVKSQDYNKWVHGPTQATSFEYMHRQDELYEYGLVIDYNTHPTVPGLGSAIFLHIWRSANQGTDGCVALEKKNVREILSRLVPADKPKIVLNPKGLE